MAAALCAAMVLALPAQLGYALEGDVEPGLVADSGALDDGSPATVDTCAAAEAGAPSTPVAACGLAAAVGSDDESEAGAATEAADVADVSDEACPSVADELTTIAWDDQDEPQDVPADEAGTGDAALTNVEAAAASPESATDLCESAQALDKLATDETVVTDAGSAGITDGAYTIGSRATTLVAKTNGGSLIASSQNTDLGEYWRLSDLGEGALRIVSLSGGSALTAAEGGLLALTKDLEDAGATWIVTKRSDGTVSLAPKVFTGLRLVVGKSGVSLAAASSDGAQHLLLSRLAALSEAVSEGATVDDGVYVVRSKADAGKVVDIAGASSANGANAQVYTSNDTLAQRFVLTGKGNGLYQVEVECSGKVLDAQGGATTRGTNVQQWRNNGTLAQLWYLERTGNAYQVKNAKSGLALGVAAAQPKNGTNVRLWTADGATAQVFSLVRDEALSEALAVGKALEEGIYSLQSGVGSSKVVDISGAGYANGANAQIYRSNSTLAQKFELTYRGHGLYTLQAGCSGKYLDAAGGGRTRGTNVQQWRGNGTRAQLWYLARSGSSYVVKSALSGLALDVSGAGTKDGTNVQLWTSNGTKAQAFALKQVPLLAAGTYVLATELDSSQLVEVANAAKSDGANVQMHRMNRSDAQKWVLSYLGNSRYRIANKNSGRLLSVAGASKASGANVEQRGTAGSNAQTWILGVSDSGAITIKNASTGLYLTVASTTCANGTNVRQAPENGTRTQAFVPYSSNSTFVTKGKTGYQNPSAYYQLSAYNCVLPSYAHGFYTYVTPSRIAPNATRSQCVEAFIQRAYDYLGTGYRWDWAMAPGQGVDCSGLVMQCLYAVGMQTPYNTYDHMFDPWQDHNAENMHHDTRFKQIAFSQRQRGDLIFYAGHVAIYLGNNLIIHAPNASSVVRINSVFSYPITGCSRVFV